MLMRLMRVLRLIQHLRRHLSHYPLPSGLCLRGLQGLRRSCMSYNRALWGYEETGQAPEKVIGVDLFYLRSMDRGTANVPYLLAHDMFSHAERRKSRARLSRGHFIGCLATLFGMEAQHLLEDQGHLGLGSLGTRELMDASGRTYQAYDRTLIGSSQLPYQRHTIHRIGDANTSASQQPDP
nr:hypothetical protein [Tanacetum cinerariifolium]